MAFKAKLDKYLGGQDKVTTFQRAIKKKGGKLPPCLLDSKQDAGKEGILKEKIRASVDKIDPARFKAMIALIKGGTKSNPTALDGTPEKDLADFENEIKSINRFSSREIKLLDASDYFALTPRTSPISADPWNPGQIIVKDVNQLMSFGKAGIEELGKNSVALGMPVAGEAARAKKFADDHPEIVDKIRALGDFKDLDDSGHELPPRFLYSVKTSNGPKTLMNLMLENCLLIAKETDAKIPALLMLNYKSSELVLDRMQRDLSHWTDDQKDNVLLFNQSTAPRVYLSDQSLTTELFATGHGDYTFQLSDLGMIDFLKDAGIKYLFFANGDEFLWGPDPIMLGIAKDLIGKGYAGVVMTTPNANKQAGGGAVKTISNPQNQFLCESPSLPTEFLVGKGPLALNTTFYVLSVEKLWEIKSNLLQFNTAIDVKPKSRDGKPDWMVSLETWAGCEFTNPVGKPADHKMAFIAGPRLGFFLGIKSLQESHGNGIPNELNGHSKYESLIAEQYIQKMANDYPVYIKQIIKGIKDNNPALLEPFFSRGYGYLI